MTRAEINAAVKLKAAKLKMIGTDVIVGDGIIVSKRTNIKDAIEEVTIQADYDNTSISLLDIPDIHKFITASCRLIITGKGKISQLTLNCDNDSIATNIKEVVIDIDTSNVYDMSYMFHGLGFTKKIEFKQIDTSNARHMIGMFSRCVGLSDLDLSKFNTSNVESMARMFDYCTGLFILDLTSFDTRKVKSMRKMFLDCIELTATDLRNFNTPMLTDISQMFSGCSNLEVINLRNFDLTNITDMTGFACDCFKLKQVYFPKNGAMCTKVKSLTEAFKSCCNLVELNLETLVGTEVESMDYAFNGCDHIEHINLKNFNPRELKDATNAFSSSHSDRLVIDLRSFNPREIIKEFIDYEDESEQEENTVTSTLESFVNSFRWLKLFVFESRQLVLILHNNEYSCNSTGKVVVDGKQYIDMTDTLLKLKEDKDKLRTADDEHLCQAGLLRFVKYDKLTVLYPAV